MPLSRWSDSQVIGQMNSGMIWHSPVISYSFPTTAANLTFLFGGAAGFSALNAEQQAKAAIVIGLWDDVIANDFSPVSGNSDVEFANSYSATLNTSGGYENYAAAYFPNLGTVWLNSVFDGSNPQLANDANNNLLNPVIGFHGFTTLIHETGHAIGLEHSGNYAANGGIPSNFRDSEVYSVMSYFGPTNQSSQVASADWIGSDGKSYSPQTPMIDDVLVLQSMYGAEVNTRSGNTTYGFNSNLSTVYAGLYDFTRNLNPIMCLVDSGGIDTLDLSGWNSVSTVDLNPGAFSSGNSMTNNLSIAFGVLIENATTGGGNDALTGNALDNVLDGGTGNDTLNGGAGDDFLIGGVGADILRGQSGTNTVSYIASASGVTVNLNLTTAQVSGGDAQGDVLTDISNLLGSSVADSLTGNALNNYIAGGGGNDIISGAGGDDRLYGGGVTTGGWNTLNGDSGIDTVDYSQESSRVYADLSLNQDVGYIQRETGFVFNDVLIGIENLIGGSGNDQLTGDSNANFILGYLGNDVINGGAGDDILAGGGASLNGFDVLYGEAGLDTISFDGISAVVYADLLSNNQLNVGVAYLNMGSGFVHDSLLFTFENITGGLGNDILLGDANGNRLVGGNGADFIIGQAGADTLIGGNGDDSLYGGEGVDRFEMDVGLDIATGGTGADRFCWAAYQQGADVVSDFSHAEGDKILLTASAFGVSPGLTLTNGFNFIVGGNPSATTATPTMMFDTATNILWFDIDGTATSNTRHAITFLSNGGGGFAVDDVLFV